MQITIDINNGAKKIINALSEKGYDAYAVGGCVRDSLMTKYLHKERTPDDWDITTSAKPDEIINLFGKSRTIPTGLAHGTVTVLINKKPFEVTSYRIDGDYSDGRHPDKVIFTDKIADDLSRRDFTINAMAYNDEAGLVDLFNGFEDLKAGIIRCVGNAADRFSEDYLRMLRAYRFAAVLGFKLDGEIESFCIQHAERVRGISAERITIEFNKLINSSNDIVVHKFMEIFCPIIIPEVYNLPKHDEIFKLMNRVEPENKLAALLHKCPAQCVSILKRMKYDNDTIKDVSSVTSYFNTKLSLDKICVKRLINQIGQKNTVSLIRIREKNVQAYLDLIDEIIRKSEPCFLSDLEINGDILIKELGIKPGKQIGQYLKLLLEKVIETPELNQRDLLIEMVKGMENSD